MIKNFDLSDYKLFAENLNSKSYLSSDGTKILKFPLKEEEKKELISEFNNQIEVYNLGIPTPKAIDMVELPNGTIGVISEFIKNKKSLSTYVREDNTRIDVAGKKMARLGALIHNTKCNTKVFRNVKDLIKESTNNIILDKDVKTFIYKILDNTEDKDICLHGDFNITNFLTTGENDYAIDLGNFCYGNPLFDLGIMEVFSDGYIFDLETSSKHLGLDVKTIISMDEAFKKYYYVKGEEFAKYKNDVETLKLYGTLMLIFHASKIESTREILPKIVDSLKKFMKANLV